MERPICQNKDCKNEALMVWADMYICGDCYVKVIEMINKQKQELLNASNTD